MFYLLMTFGQQIPVTATGLERTTTYVVNEQLAKWLRVRLRSKWLWVRVPLQSLNIQILRLFRARSSLTFRSLESVDSLETRI